MKALVRRYRFLFLYLVPMVVLVLVLCSGFLYKENREVRRINRELMVQNDSILSVNLELKNALSRKAALQGRTGVSFKVK